MADTRTYHLPIADEGDGGVVAEIRVYDGDLDWHALTAVAEILGRSKAPITLSFAVDRPPPLFVTREDAARSLGTSPDYIDKLWREGVLPEVKWDNSAPGSSGHVHHVIPWDSLVAVAEEAKRTGELPLLTTRLRRKPSAKGQPTILAVVGDVLREAKERGEKPLSPERIKELVDERLGEPVPAKSIQSAYLAGIKRGFIKRHPRGYRPGMRGRAHLFSWLPAVEVRKPAKDADAPVEANA